MLSHLHRVELFFLATNTAFSTAAEPHADIRPRTHFHRDTDTEPLAQNVARSESKGDRLHYFWRFIIDAPTARSPVKRIRVYALMRGHGLIYP
ncbi:hypothetical protein F5B17DRAFT_396651 [Nemania serpens]|nr:hypothetical protein F5B17DRAFT_396651 [Nemania serpens]